MPGFYAEGESVHMSTAHWNVCCSRNKISAIGGLAPEHQTRRLVRPRRVILRTVALLLEALYK
jgi:hypothetical protein